MLIISILKEIVCDMKIAFIGAPEEVKNIIKEFIRERNNFV